MYFMNSFFSWSCARADFFSQSNDWRLSIPYSSARKHRIEGTQESFMSLVKMSQRLLTLAILVTLCTAFALPKTENKRIVDKVCVMQNYMSKYEQVHMCLFKIQSLDLESDRTRTYTFLTVSDVLYSVKVWRLYHYWLYCFIFFIFCKGFYKTILQQMFRVVQYYLHVL